jgi:hypothetical protein
VSSKIPSRGMVFLINDCLNWDFLDFSFYIEEVTILEDIYNGFYKTVKVRYPI